MIKKLRNKYYDKWSVAYTAILLIIVLLVTAESVFPQVHALSHFFFSRYALVLLLGSYLIFRGFNAEIEIKLIFAYGLWNLISRFLNSGYSVSHDDIFVFYLYLFICMYVSAGLCLTKERRERFEGVLFWLISGFYAVMGCFIIYTYISGKDIYLSCFEQPFSTLIFDRTYLSGENPNLIAYWFMVSAVLSIWLFAKYKNIFAKISAALIFVLNFWALTATDCRSCKLGFSVAAAIIIIILVLKKLKNKTAARTALAVIIAAAIAVPAVYGSFALPLKLSGELAEISSAKAAEEETAPENSDEGRFEDLRGVRGTGRLDIYKGGMLSLKEEPLRLLIGSSNEDLMSITNRYLQEECGDERPPANHHNSFLNALISTGIPGFAIIVCFLVFLIRRMALVFFSDDKRASVNVKIYVAALAGMLIYNMFECSLFYASDIRAVLFFICSGMFLGYSYEIFPRKEKAK